MKKMELIDHVAETTGKPKRVVREIADALFSSIHEQLQAEEVVVIPPLGRIVVRKFGEGDEQKTAYKVILATPKSEEEVAEA
ncbi:HU family DNA-binding protein [Oceanicella sp. SM1341]|uniref:HU family DNA-binding protein n=1 Tax=Oceanicella sp. SM1341 TaxID=1548889 RepID=UPI00130090DF|nr:HU family DNA-binding protein [Oceanicella sp. SM1341]